MASFDAHSNFAISTVVTPPSPPASGLSLSIEAGHGAARFGTAIPPYNITVQQAGVLPDPLTAEVCRVTARVGDTFTIVRTQEGTAARAIQVGDLIYVSITAKSLTDIETAIGTTAPVLHHLTHEDGGSDEVSLASSQVTGLDTALAGKVETTDPRLTDARVPLAHAPSHGLGQSDPVSVTALAGYPGGATAFLRADATFAVPAGGGGTGDVVGPASSVDNAVALFSGTTGKLLDAGPDGTVAGSLAIGSPSALTGALRLPNNTSLVARSVGNLVDLPLIGTNTGNDTVVGNASAGIVMANAVDVGANWLSVTERGPAPVPGADKANVFLRDNGAGSSQLAVQYSAGVAKVLAELPLAAADLPATIAYENEANVFTQPQTISGASLTVGTTISERGRTTPLGDWITIPFNAANYSGNGGGWTVTSVTEAVYTRIGQTLILTIASAAGTVGAGVTALLIVAPVTLVGRSVGAALLQLAGGVFELCFCGSLDANVFIQRGNTSEFPAGSLNIVSLTLTTRTA